MEYLRRAPLPPRPLVTPALDSLHGNTYIITTSDYLVGIGSISRQWGVGGGGGGGGGGDHDTPPRVEIAHSADI